MVVQLHIIAEEDKVRKTRKILSTTPGDMDKLRTQELLLGSFIQLI